MSNVFEVPKSITKTLYITMDVGGYNVGEITIYDYDITKSSYSEGKYVVLHTTDITIVLPPHSDDELRQKAVNVLEQEKANIKAAAYAAERKVQDKIDDLLRITYVAGVGDDN